MRLLIIFFLIALPFRGRCQAQNDYHNSAAERIKNKSWECVGSYVNDRLIHPESPSKYITFFQERDIKSWVGEKYKNRLKYSAVKHFDYRLDSLNNYVKNSGSCDLPTWLFTDSTNKEGLYIVAARSPLYEEDGSGIEDHFFEISFLSDTEFVLPWTDRLGVWRSYFKVYPTPPEFYQEHKIQQH